MYLHFEVIYIKGKNTEKWIVEKNDGINLKKKNRLISESERQ